MGRCIKIDTMLFWVGGGGVVRRCWVKFQCRGVLLIWIIVGQGPIALAVGAGGGVWTFFSLIYHFSFLSFSQRAFGAKMTLCQRRCDVITSHRR